MLDRIYAAKAAVLERERMETPEGEVRRTALARTSERRPFLRALRSAPAPAVIAEIKRASPSAGIIAKDFDALRTAIAYEAAGADAISVVTESAHFLGDLRSIDRMRRATHLPILRKDFLWTRYQIAQSAAAGADCVLLIVAGTSDAALRDCLDEARRYGLDALVEVHNAAELQRGFAAGAELIGINNRDLRTLDVDLRVTERVMTQVPPGTFVVSESGIRSAEDAARMRAAGAHGFLVGEALMRATRRSEFVASLRGADAGVTPAPRGRSDRGS